MPSVVRENLVIAAAELVRTDVGQKFLEAFRPYVEEARESLVMAPIDHTAYAQGVARQSTVFLRLLEGAPAEATKILETRDAAKLRSRK